MSKKTFSYLLCILFLLAFPLCGGAKAALNFIVEHPKVIYDGQPFVITITAPINLRTAKVIWFEKELEVPLTPFNQGLWSRGECLLGLPLDSKPKTHMLEIQPVEDLGQTVEFYREGIPSKLREYPKQELTVEPKYVDPPAEFKERIEEERALLREALSEISPERYWTLPFTVPTPGVTTSDFGLRRVFNKTPRGAHMGLDLDGKEGDEIRACARGRVVLSEDMYYSGQIIVLDHGLGVHTLYLHMSKRIAEVGQLVEPGELIGLIGKTGRVTGPHLHLGLNILGASLDPVPLIPGVGQGVKSHSAPKNTGNPGKSKKK